ncbi:MAG TPA: radical SAM protein [Desulfomonilaceae bacterium]|nr:radical SAM protein [Desulfomonilaceae bacterium]
MRAPSPYSGSTPMKESPDFVRLSLAAAMTLGFVNGWFYRNAQLHCINLLLTYADGCKANCAFCGLAGEKYTPTSRRNFIRVPWKVFPTAEVMDAIRQAPDHVSRVCISMITHPRSKSDVLKICREAARITEKRISLLIAPTMLKREDLVSMKDSGADRVGVAIDGATSEIFEQLRGKPVHGPHRWDQYWRIYSDALEVFGEGMAGVHLICGLGETEQELVSTISRARSMGGCTHLFSFFPEKGSLMENNVPPPIGAYRRIQLARWLIDNDRTRIEDMEFDARGRILDYGIPDPELNEIISSGGPFETSGCPGPDGQVACNRPYGNEKPGTLIRNFPFSPEPEDLERIAEELADYTD